MAALKLWTLGVSSPRSAARKAERAEQAGWAGITVVDSQNLDGDSYVALATMALATNRLGLATGVTNPITRHPAVTAAAAHSVGTISDGRMTLGIGRGDSALAHVGLAPAGVSFFETYVSIVRRYLHGDSVDFEDLAFFGSKAPDVETLKLAHAPDQSRLKWRRKDDPIVDIEVAATGPNVIAAAARSADRVIFALGADPSRIAWGIETARQARIDVDLDPDAIEFGAYLNLVAHPDVGIARQLVAGGLSTFARFSVMHGTVNGPATEAQTETFASLSQTYDMTSHTKTDSDQARALSDDFIDQYAIVGAPGYCAERLDELAGLGLTKALIIGPSAGSDKDQARVATGNMIDEVLPHFA